MRYESEGPVCGRCAARTAQERGPTPASCPSGKTVRERDRVRLFVMGLAALLLAAGVLFEDMLHRTPYFLAEYLVFLSSYLLVGGKVLRRAAGNLARGKLFDESFLMGVATLGAIAIHELPEAAAVMLFYAVGEYFQDLAVDRSRRSIAALLAVRPDYAHLKMGGETRRVAPEEVQPGHIIVVRPGERIPLDGEVVQGVSFVDTSPLTGEAVPRRVEAGDKVLAGAVNGDGLLEVRVTRPFAASSVARILDLVERAAARKAPTEQFLTVFAHYYTPTVVAGAAALALIPPLVLPGATPGPWVHRALVLLVIACPCALMVSVPLGYFGGIGGASRQGVLVKGANFLDALGRLHTVVFDKTGTLTRGVFRVTEVAARNGFTRDEVLRLAAAAETHSNHPIARSIREAYGGKTFAAVDEHREIPGQGIQARVEGRTVLVGNERLLRRAQIPHEICDPGGTVVYVAVDRVWAGYIVIGDEIKEDAPQAVAGLKRLGVKKTVLLTGDDEAVARRVAAALNLDGYYARMLPEEKVAKLEELLASVPRPGRDKVAFVGDGINDAPVITRADVGVAMGGLGSDAAIEAADVVLMDDRPAKLVTAVEVARHTRSIVWQNIGLALGVKALFVVLGALGAATIWEAVFADVGVALLAVFNATRSFGYRRGRSKPFRARGAP